MPRASTIVRKAGWVITAGALALCSANAAITAAERRGEAGLLAGFKSADGLVRLQVEQQALAADPNYRVSASSVAAVRETLRSRPFNPQALALMGIAAAYTDEKGIKTGRLMDLADQVTRREPVSQLWMIEAASAAGDVSKTIRHYHTALATNPSLYPTLFPVLTSALDFPEVQQSVRAYFDRNPPWLADFLGFASGNAKIDSFLGLIGKDRSVLKSPLYDQTNAQIVYRLAETGRTEDALNFAKQVFEGFDKEAFQKFGVSRVTSDPRLGRLAWGFANQDGVRAELVDAEMVKITVEPSGNGSALTRLHIVATQPAKGITALVEAAEGTSLPSVRWLARCAVVPENQQVSLGRTEVRPIGGAKYRIEALFEGAARCGLTEFRLAVAAPDVQFSSIFTVSLIEM